MQYPLRSLKTNFVALRMKWAFKKYLERQIMYLTVRANEATHILHDTQDFDIHLTAEVEFLTDRSQSYVLGRSDKNSTVWIDVLQCFDNCKMLVWCSGRRVWREKRTNGRSAYRAAREKWPYAKRRLSVWICSCDILKVLLHITMLLATNFRRFPKILQKLPEDQTNVSEHYP